MQFCFYFLRLFWICMPLTIPYKIEDWFLYFCKKRYWNFDRIEQNLQIIFGSIDTLTISSLLIHRCLMFSHQVSIYFSKVLQFSMHKSFTYLVKLTHPNFIPLDAPVNPIIFLISFWHCLLLAHRNKHDFLHYFFHNSITPVICHLDII